MNPPATEPTAPQTDWAGVLVAGLLFGWIVGVAPVAYAFTWGVAEVFQAVGLAWPGWVGPAVALAQGLLLALPLVPLARFWRRPRYRAVFGTWAWGAAWLLGALPLRLLPATASTLAVVGQMVLALGFLLLAWRWLRARRLRDWPGGSPLPALAVAPLLAAGWLAWTAPGSPLDTLLNGLAALLLGGWVALLATGFLFPALQGSSPSLGWNVALGGFVLGTLLLVVATAFGFQGQALLLVGVLPALGWAAAALSLWGQGGRMGNGRAVALLVGLAAAAPMILVDPEELTLVLNVSGRDVLVWALAAAGVSVLAGWLLGVVGWLLRGWLARRRPSPAWWGGVAATWLAGVALFFGVGQPGWHGDRLFVILAEQADLSAAPAIADRDERLRYSYGTLTAHAARTQAPLRAALERLGVPYRPYYLVNAIEVEGGPLHRLWLASRPEVDRVILSPVLRPLPALPPTSEGDALPPDGPAWNLTTIGADRVWDELGVRGEGIVVGQSDSGVQGDHSELADGYRGRAAGDDFNWYDPWYGTAAPRDIGGHGTHTLGSVLGNRVGVAPAAEWIGCVNLARNLANPALYLECLQFMLAPFPQGGDPLTAGDPTRAAHVLNNSWGCPALEGCDATALLPAVQALRAAGIFVVASAGNEGAGGCSTLDDPIALYDEVFSVGAVTSGGQLAEFSSLGPVTADGSGRRKPDIAAPGVEVLSAFPGSSYALSSGTSMAGPHVAGVVALMWSANPALIGDIERTEQLLIESAQPARGDVPDCGSGAGLPNNAVGYGIVDAFEAVQRALAEE